jgi:hypothetical protein
MVGALILAIGVLGTVAVAQGPLKKQVDFTINAPYKLKRTNYVLPPGKYILRQVNDLDLNLFALYREDLMRSPIAMIRTVRIDYRGTDYPEDANVHGQLDETSASTRAIVTGWDIPGMDGWEIIAVTPRGNGHRILTGRR